MSEYMIPFTTYSQAAKAHDDLRNNYISSQIVRTPSGMNRSCGYSLKVSEHDMYYAQSVINAPYDGYYR